MSEAKKQKILIIYAHPDQAGSTANKAMIEAAQQVDNVTIVDLYALYPDFKINVAAQHELLFAHDVIIFQFPLYWYSSPALLKEWQDLVIVHGITYGAKITALKDKPFLCVVSAGATAQDFTSQGKKGRTLRHLLSPFEQTVQLCKMQFIPPYVLYDTQADDAAQKTKIHAAQYAQLLIALRDQKLDIPAAQSRDYLNISPLPLITVTTS